MDYASGTLVPDRWQWVIEHAGPFLTILVAAVALAAAAAWFISRARYRRMTAEQRRKLAEYEDALGGATPDEARARLESLQARLAYLEPRRLTGKQKAVLKRQLTLPEAAGVTDISVAYDAACPDGKQYAADFVHALGSLRGWHPFTSTMFGTAPRANAGLAISCFSHGRTAAGAKLLSRAFSEAGIEHDIVQSPDEQLELVVTSRLSVPEPSGDLLDD